VSNQDWQPGTSIELVELAARLRAAIHEYMREHGVLEVVTPILSSAASTDPHIHSIQAAHGYLHTSPEFPMKRLLAAHSRDIYQIATVFREGESGRFHNREFSMLEWYRVGMDHHQLMQDVGSLMQHCLALTNIPWSSPNTVCYIDAVASVCEVAFDSIDVTQIEKVFDRHGRSFPTAIENDLDAAMDLLMDEFVISQFADNAPTFVVDYPVSQAALARLGENKDGLQVAERFELYWGKLELANGFHELADADEQRQRFERELQKRAQLGIAQPPMDERLLGALNAGLPDCAGVALGLDRLLMMLCDANDIKSVIAFPSDIA